MMHCEPTVDENFLFVLVFKLKGLMRFSIRNVKPFLGFFTCISGFGLNRGSSEGELKTKFLRLDRRDAFALGNKCCDPIGLEC